MSKFTRGKWKYLYKLYEITAYPEGEGEWQCNEWGHPTFPNGSLWRDITGRLSGEYEYDEEAHANGRLIAAAPEMYELLKSIAYPEEPIITKALKASNKARELLRRIDGEECQS